MNNILELLLRKELYFVTSYEAWKMLSILLNIITDFIKTTERRNTSMEGALLVQYERYN